MKRLFVVLPLLVMFAVPVQADDLIFQCFMKGDVEVKLEREVKSDTWTMTRTEPTKPPLVIVKNGKNMAVGSMIHAAVSTAITEIYVNTDPTLYVLGSSERGTEINGYVQEMQNGVQTAYGDCDSKTFRVDFSAKEVFDNFTIVD